MRKTVSAVCVCVSLLIAHQALGQSSLTIIGPTGISGVDSQTTAMNERGQVVGFGMSTLSTPSCAPEQQPTYRAFSWTAKGGMIDLGSLGGCRSHARVVNNWGHIAGESLLAGDTEWHAFFWTPETGMIDMRVFGERPYIADINDRGQVVGGSQHLTTDRQSHAFSWTLKGGYIDLGPGWAVAVNERGQVSGYVQGEHGYVAVLWETSGR